ncbi:MAG: hypothetical protein KAH57_05230 [Thermoplasmata archaeon]|nr:hypothetical protein [Thermoplasmata archaeon]
MVDQPANRLPQQRLPPAGGTPRPRGGPSPFSFLLILLFIAYVVVFIILPQYTDVISEALLADFQPLYRLVVAGALFVVIALILIVSRSRKSAPPRGRAPTASALVGTPPKQGEVKRFKPVIPKVDGPEKAVDGPVVTPPKVFIYPKEVEGGIYGDTYISIDEKKVMKLRSLVVEPEYLI